MSEEETEGSGTGDVRSQTGETSESIGSQGLFRLNSKGKLESERGGVVHCLKS